MAERSGIPVKRKSTSVKSDDTKLDENPQIIAKLDKTPDTKPAKTSTSEPRKRSGEGNGPDEQIAQEKNENLKDSESSHSADNQSTWLYYSIFMVVTLSSFVTRLYNIEIPPWIW